MSVILPYQYKYLADKLGQMYAKIRDSIFDESDATCAFNVARETITTTSNSPHFTQGGIFAESDTTTWGCAAAGVGESEISSNPDYSNWISNTSKYIAPPMSVNKDIASSWFDFVNTTLNESSAKSVASAQIGSALRKLNQHITSRQIGTDGNKITNITTYYSQYAFIPDATATSIGMQASQLSIFDIGTTAGLDVSPTYFSQDFAELSAQIGVTINSQYVQ